METRGAEAKQRVKILKRQETLKWQELTISWHEAQLGAEQLRQGEPQQASCLVGHCDYRGFAIAVEA